MDSGGKTDVAFKHWPNSKATPALSQRTVCRSMSIFMDEAGCFSNLDPDVSDSLPELTSQ